MIGLLLFGSAYLLVSVVVVSGLVERGKAKSVGPLTDKNNNRKEDE